MNATWRQIDIAGTFNVRDLGGLRARSGQLVRRGMLYRAGDMGRLAPEGVRRLQSLRVAACSICGRRPTLSGSGASRSSSTGSPISTSLLESRTVEPDALPRVLPPNVLLRISRRIADEGAEEIGQVIELLAGEQSLPAVVHCVAGKDRTGVVAGLLLALLDVPDEVIADDYALSKLGMAQVSARAEQDAQTAAWFMRIPPAILEARPATMLAFVDWMRERHGSVENFAARAGVLTAYERAMPRAD